MGKKLTKVKKSIFIFVNSISQIYFDFYLFIFQIAFIIMIIVYFCLNCYHTKLYPGKVNYFVNCTCSFQSFFTAFSFLCKWFKGASAYVPAFIPLNTGARVLWRRFVHWVPHQFKHTLPKILYHFQYWSTIHPYRKSL